MSESSSPERLSVPFRIEEEEGSRNPRFQMLDALRGLAALAVVMHHLKVGSSFNLGHHAVLIFFVISGYCVTAAAESCRKRGLGFSSYMKRRVRRIYPPYCIALLAFIATRVVKLALGRGDQLPANPFYWIQNFTMTQWLSLLGSPTSWAADNRTLTVAAFWSLNYEEQFYMVLGLLVLATTRFGASALVSGTLSLFAVGAAWNLVFPSTSFGIFFEYWVPFGAGGLLYFILCGGLPRGFRRLLDVVLLGTFLVGLLASATRSHAWGGETRDVFAEWTMALGFALVLRVTRPWSEAFARAKASRPLMLLGTITYSLYLVHQFNLTSSAWLAGQIVPASAPAGVALAVQALLLVGLGTGFWYLFERPFLNRPLESPGTVSLAQVAATEAPTA